MPRKRETGARVLGPYQEATRCRIVVVENGRRTYHFTETWEDAMRLFTRLRRQAAKRSEARRIGDLVAEYRDHRIALATAKRETVEHAIGRVRLMLSGNLDEDVRELTPARAAALYEAHIVRPCRRGRPLAASSQRWDLKLTRAFFSWAVERGFVEADPFAGVKPVGKPNVGKEQLRLDEARRFSEAALSNYAERGDPLAVASLCALWLGLRASEALNREVRDLDDGGRVLWVPSGKSKNARRRLLVPEPLRGPLLGLAAGRAAEAPLFMSAETGCSFSRSTLHRAVAMLCRQAGVRVVCPHSLRGLHSTLALDAGATSAAVASALGHGSFVVTARHYANPDAVANSTTSRVAEALGGEVNGGAAELLRGLDEATLRELLALLAERKKGR